MTIKEYTESCLKFAEASKGWEKLDENSFYTTFDKSWEMSGDNQNGGVGIEWAFHLTEDEIRAQAPENSSHTSRRSWTWPSPSAARN